MQKISASDLVSNSECQDLFAPLMLRPFLVLAQWSCESPPHCCHWTGLLFNERMHRAEELRHFPVMTFHSMFHSAPAPPLSPLTEVTQQQANTSTARWAAAGEWSLAISESWPYFTSYSFNRQYSKIIKTFFFFRKDINKRYRRINLC